MGLGDGIYSSLSSIDQERLDSAMRWRRLAAEYEEMVTLPRDYFFANVKGQARAFRFVAREIMRDLRNHRGRAQVER
jgi:hypothetical protein